MALKAIHLVDEGAYLVESGYGEEYEVDGMKMPQKAVVQSLDKIVRVKRIPPHIVAYTDASGARLTAAEYADKSAELLTGAHREDGELQFPSLEAEFEYRKFAERWCNREYSEQTAVREPASAEVTEIRVESGDPDIVSLWNSPHVRNDVRLYSLNRDALMIRTAMEQCAAAGLSFDNATHSGLRFAKIDGAYAFDDTFSESRPFIGTVEQCRAEKAKCIDRVTRIVRPRAAQKKGVTLSNAGSVLLALKDVQRLLLGVRAKQDTASSLVSARERVATLVEGLHNSLPTA